MLQDMTTLLATISSGGDVIDVLYSQIAQTNLIYALGKHIQVSSVSSSCFGKSEICWLAGCKT